MEDPSTTEQDLERKELDAKILEVFLEQYRHGIMLQKVGNYKDAFCCYKIIVPLIANEPMIWIRLTECCISSLYDFARDAPPFNLSPIGHHPDSARLHIIDDFSYLMEQEKAELNINEISLPFAEMAITTANCLVRTSNDAYLKRYIKAQGAFIAMKRGRYRQALLFANSVLETEPANKYDAFEDYITGYAHLIKAECLLKQGHFQDAYKNLTETKIEVNDEKGKPMLEKAIRYDRCMALCGQRKFIEAKEIYMTLLDECFPRDFVALGTYIFVQLGEFAEFKRIFQTVASKSIQSSETGQSTQSNGINSLSAYTNGHSLF